MCQQNVQMPKRCTLSEFNWMKSVGPNASDVQYCYIATSGASFVANIQLQGHETKPTIFHSHWWFLHLVCTEGLDRRLLLYLYTL